MVIWLTGCTAGLGKALVKEFLLEGHTVIGGGRSVDKLNSLQEIYDPDHAKFLSLDVAQDGSCISFSHEAYKHSGAPDFLINNASIINQNANLWDISAKDFDELTAININGAANMIRHTVPNMIKAVKGIIVNLSSGWGRSTSPHVAPYCASKWAIEGLTKALAQELPDGLATVALNPGVINTDMLQKTYGSNAYSYPSAEQWAKTAAPFITSIKAIDNGASLTAP